ncbi:MAG: hypothetical protein U0360_10195 [Dehalococcoidia bacterium]
MAIPSISAASSVVTGASEPTGPVASGFASSLASQQQLEAARTVLEALPAPIVYSLRDNAGSPSEAVDRLFAVLKDGSFDPPPGPLGRPESIIGATAHAASLFDSPAQLWDAMRGAIGSAMSAPRPVTARPTGSAAVRSPGAPPPPEVHSLADAERLLTDLRAHPIASATSDGPAMTDWWEAALRFLLGAHTESRS